MSNIIPLFLLCRSSWGVERAVCHYQEDLHVLCGRGERGKHKDKLFPGVYYGLTLICVQFTITIRAQSSFHTMAT